MIRTLTQLLQKTAIIAANIEQRMCSIWNFGTDSMIDALILLSIHQHEELGKKIRKKTIKKIGLT